MIRELNQEDMLSLAALGEKYINNFSELYISYNYKYYGYFNEDTIQGFLITEKTVDESSIILLYVDEDYRRKNIASSLLNDYFNNRLSDDKRIILEVSDNNIAAIKLYEKFGFKQIAIRSQYYPDGSNGILMERKNNS